MTSLASKQFKWNQAKEVFNPFIDPQGLILFLWVVANEVVNGSAIFIKVRFCFKTPSSDERRADLTSSSSFSSSSPSRTASEPSTPSFSESPPESCR